MTIDRTHDDTELTHQDRGAHRLIVRSRCWPLPSDSDETQLALPTDDCQSGGETAMAGAAHVRARRRRRGPRAEVVIRPFPPEPEEALPDVPMPAFDEVRAASLATTEPGGAGHRNAFECIAAIVAADRTAA
jgi:hypothetical protein